VAIEESSRTTTSGATVAIDLFIPTPSDPAQPDAPFPTVVLSHGFARNKAQHRNNAVHMAERGILVATPNSPGWFGDSAQQDNIDALIGHVGWLLARSGTPGNSLEGCVDPSRLGLAGHSAGGAVSFEAAIGLQDTPERIGALCLLDGVPWPRTLDAAAALHPLRFGTLRGEPSNCNSSGNILDLLTTMGFNLDDVRVVGATHCDPENPTDLGCTLFCGGTNAARRTVFRNAVTFFFMESFGLSLPDEPESYAEYIHRLSGEGTVVVAPITNPVVPPRTSLETY
jgi:pimeloyl-ACP methyl ester carboxylesterase